MAVSHFFSQPKDYGINGFLPKGTLQLFRFLLTFSLVRPDSLLSFFRFFFWKNVLRSEAEHFKNGTEYKDLNSMYNF